MTKQALYAFLRWSERHTKTDMVYLTSGSFWLILSQIVAMAASFGVAVAFAHLASPDAYGNYRYIIVLWGLCSAFSLTGIGTALTRASAHGYDGSLWKGMKLSFKWSLLGSVLALIIAGYYFFIEENLFVALSLCIVACFSPFLSSFSLFDPFLIGKRDFKRQSLYVSLNTVLPVLALLMALYISDRAIVFILVFFIANAAADAFFYFLSLREVKNKMVDPNLASYSAHLSVMGVISTLANRVDSVVIFTLFGPASLAVYAFAIALPEQIKGFAKAATTVALPRFAQRPLTEIRLTIGRRIFLFAFLLTLLTVCYILVAPWLFEIFFPIYSEAVAYSRWFALSIILVAVSAPLTAILEAHKRTRELYFLSNISAAVLVLTLPVLTYFYGIAGAIAGQLIYRSASALLVTWQFTKVSQSFQDSHDRS